MNETWREFKERIYGNDYMIWHDGVGDCSYELARENPNHVRAMILEGLAEEDYVAVEALKQVDMPDMLPDLRKQLLKTYGKYQIELATYLQEKDPEATDDRYAKIVIHELDHPTYVMRMDSAILLRHFPAEHVKEALLRHIVDPDYYVRYHSAESYLRVLKMEPNDISKYEDIFALIRTPLEGEVTDEHDKRYRQASEMLRAFDKSEEPR